MNKIYYFETVAVDFKDKTHFDAKTHTILGEMEISDTKKEKLLKFFYHYAPVNIEEIKTDIENVISELTNPILKALTKTIYDRYKEDFYLYPAATKFHHAYISGLAYHTHSMLRLAKGFFIDNTKPIKSAENIQGTLIFSSIIHLLVLDTARVSGRSHYMASVS